MFCKAWIIALKPVLTNNLRYGWERFLHGAPFIALSRPSLLIFNLLVEFPAIDMMSHLDVVIDLKFWIFDPRLHPYNIQHC